ncbi:MAG TPA: DUF423 domain-containing protein [Bacteroidota bacterium]|nr:DUF423 domain-containing protein [Bacteroidota bacterium]
MNSQKEISRRFLLFGALSGGIGVALGAFGAHGLKNILGPAMLSVFETGVRYQMYHALAMLVVGALAGTRNTPKELNAAGWSFLAGTALFSGSLYVFALTGEQTFAMVTPVGGAAFLAGWGALAWAAMREK